MKQEKKQKTQPDIEAPFPEDKSESTLVPYVVDSTSQVKTLLDGRAGYIVPCGMCGTDIWTSYYNEDTVYFCPDCSETFPR